MNEQDAATLVWLIVMAGSALAWVAKGACLAAGAALVVIALERMQR